MESPEYAAVTVSVPTGSTVVVQVAVPEATVEAVHPVFALQVMVPVSVLPIPGVMVAVKVTDWPKGDGVRLVDTAVVVTTEVQS